MTLPLAASAPITPRHEGRGILVSGGTSGLGLAAAKRFADEGAAVWIMGKHPESVARALGEVAAAGGSAVDVTDELAVEEAVDDARRGLGSIDAAFVSAAVAGEDRDVMDLSVEAFRRVLDVNVVGAFLVARAAARGMAERSAIVFNASVNGLIAAPRLADYSASKAALLLLARTMALDLAPRGVTVISICPGGVAAGFADPAEIAAVVSFLCSPEAAYMTGAVIPVDGGRSAT